MPELNLDDMSISELKQLEKEVARAIATFEIRRVTEAKAEVEEFAKKLGFKLGDLLDPGSSKKRAPLNPPKYRNPENPEQTWSGLGRQPAWIKAALAEGKSLDEFAI